MDKAFSNPFEAIDARLSLIEQLLIEIKHRPPGESSGQNEQKQVLSLADFCQYTGIGKQTAYRLTSRGEVPHSKRGKRLYFDKAQVDAWLLANHVGGSAEAIARRAAEIVLADLEKTKLTDYDPTRRLSRHEAARHLGISVRTLDARVAAGLIRKYCPSGQRPYYLMGELDGVLPTPRPGKLGR